MDSGHIHRQYYIQVVEETAYALGEILDQAENEAE